MNASAVVTWDAPIDDGGASDSYTVVAVPSNGTVPKPASGLSATITGLTNNVTYVFNVSASNYAGPGAASTSNPVTPPGTPPVPPGAVVSLAAVAVVWGVDLGWSPPPLSNLWPILNYTIVYGYAGNWTTSNVSGAVQSVSLAGLSPYLAPLWTFVVWGCNVAGPGANSTVTSRTLPFASPPSAPFGVVGVPGDTTVSLSWHLPHDDGGEGIANCTATCSPCSGGPACVAYGPGGSECTVRGLVNGVGYSFTVSCANTAGSSPTSQPSAVVYPTAASNSVPGAPQAPYVTAIARCESVRVCASPRESLRVRATVSVLCRFGCT